MRVIRSKASKKKYDSEWSVFLIAPILLVFLVGATFYYSLERAFSFGDDSHQPDSVMLRNFQDNKSEFQELVKMVQSDKGLKRVDDTWTSPENPTSIGISQERISDYRDLFYRLNIPRGFSNFMPDEIQFIATTVGFLPGSGKGYAYRIQPPKTEDMRDSLDYSPSGSGTRYRHIEGNWYLLFDR